MPWTERDLRTGEQDTITGERAVQLTKDTAKDLPRVQKEEVKAFDPVKYQPVRSPNIYDAEFGVKGNDLIFHFWPFNYHEAERRNIRLPDFAPQFEGKLKLEMEKVFGAHRVEFKYDGDMGAWYAKANGWGENQFAFDLAVKACKALHLAMGGSEA